MQLRQLKPTQASRTLPRFPTGGGGGDKPPPGGPTSPASSHRHGQMRAKKGKEPPVRLTGSVNGEGQFEIMCPQGFDLGLWSAVRICLETYSGQEPSSSPGPITLEGDARAASRYLEVVNASIYLLMKLDLSTPEVAQVLNRFPDIVGVVEAKGHKSFALTSILPGGKPPIASINTKDILVIATGLVKAGQPAACCNLLAACGAKLHHLEPFLLSDCAAALVHWPKPTDRLYEKLAKVGNAMLHNKPDALRALLGSSALPRLIREALLPQMPPALGAQDARDAALLTSWVSSLSEVDLSTGAPERILRKLLGEGASMPRLLDLARVLADEPLGDAFKERLTEVLIHVAHATLRAAWCVGEAKDDVDFLTEIPKANDGDPPRALRPLLQCVLIGAVLGEKVALAIWIRMLCGIEKEHIWSWSETGRELETLLDEMVGVLWQVGAQLELELEVALALQTLHRFGTKIRDESVAVLARRAGCEIAAQQFKQLVERLPGDTHDGLLARSDLIESALRQVLRGEALGPVDEMSAGDQQAILDALLNSEACREFLRWMAHEAGYDVVRAVMVSLLGPRLHLAPAALHEMLMAQTNNNDKFALAVALCPLVSTLQPDESAPAFIEALLGQWAPRADALTLLLGACIDSKQHLAARDMDMLLEACTASKMYWFLMTAPALRHVLEGPADHLKRCIEQALDDREEPSGFASRILLLFLAGCALRASRNAGVFEDAADGLCESVGSAFDNLEVISKIVHGLYGGSADMWFSLMLRLRISPLAPGEAARQVRFLLDVYEKRDYDENLKAAIFKSKLSPLPRRSLEHMTKDEKKRWQQDFQRYALILRGNRVDSNQLFRFCTLLLSHLNDARASQATLSLALTMIEEAVADYGGLPVRPEGLDELLSVMDNAKTRAKGKEKNEATQITIPLPGRSEDVKSLTEVDNEAEFARVISDLIDARLFEAELAMLLVRSMEDLWHGIAQPKLLLALLFKAGVFVDGYQRPAANQLAWLGEQCCTWQTSGRNFVTFLHKEFSSWTPDQWSMVDAEQLAAFMSGVLDSTLDYLDEKPKNIDKIDGHVSTLISLWGILMDKCLGERLDDSKRVQRCLELLELLEKRQSVRIL